MSDRRYFNAAERESLARWIVSVVDAMDTLPEGKYDTPVPPYIAPVGNGHMRPPAGRGWEDAHLT